MWRIQIFSNFWIWKTIGSANDKIASDLEELVFLCLDAGLDVVGISFDGDPSLNLKSYLSNLFKDYEGILAFEDMYNLTKCCHYQIVCGLWV